jgi:hypothetical protein
MGVVCQLRDYILAEMATFVVLKSELDLTFFAVIVADVVCVLLVELFRWRPKRV